MSKRMGIEAFMSNPPTNNNDELIPRTLQLAAAEIAAVCRKFDLSSCDVELCGGESWTRVKLNWRQGRHGAEKDYAKLSLDHKFMIDIDTLVEASN